MNIPDSDTLVILGIGAVWVVGVVLDWCGVEVGGEAKEPKGFDVIEKEP